MNVCFYQSVKAVADDVYNIKPRQIASSSSFAIKNLFGSYFTAIMGAHGHGQWGRALAHP